MCGNVKWIAHLYGDSQADCLPFFPLKCAYTDYRHEVGLFGFSLLCITHAHVNISTTTRVKSWGQIFIYFKKVCLTRALLCGWLFSPLSAGSMSPLTAQELKLLPSQPRSTWLFSISQSMVFFPLRQTVAAKRQSTDESALKGGRQSKKGWENLLVTPLHQ